MADEHLVFDGDPFADEAVGGNLAPFPDPGAFLDLDEGADPAVAADGAAIEIHQFRMMDPDAFAQLHGI